MHAFQIIKHEYNSDDGHYEHEPESETIYLRESDAIAVRNKLNGESVTNHNLWMADHTAADITAEFYKEYIFKGDPNDAEAVQSFANRQNCLTYFTVTTLRVFQ